MAQNFNEREQRVMALAWQCLETDPKINYAKLAPLINVGGTAAACVAWNRIKTKLNAVLHNAGSAAASPPNASQSSKKTPAKKAMKGRQPSGDEEVNSSGHDKEETITRPECPNTGAKVGSSPVSPTKTSTQKTPPKRKRGHMSDDEMSEDDQDHELNDGPGTLSLPETPSPVRFQAPRRAKSNRPVFVDDEVTDSEGEYEAYETPNSDQEAGESGSETDGTEVSSQDAAGEVKPAKLDELTCEEIVPETQEMLV